MKNLNIALEDYEYEKLRKIKDALKLRTWKDLLFYPVNGNKRHYIVETIDRLKLIFTHEFVENIKALLLLIHDKKIEDKALKDFQKLLKNFSK